MHAKDQKQPRFCQRPRLAFYLGLQIRRRFVALNSSPYVRRQILCEVFALKNEFVATPNLN